MTKRKFGERLPILAGTVYLLPSSRLARCQASGAHFVTFRYQDSNDEVTLDREFAEGHLVPMPDQVSVPLFRTKAADA